VHRPRHHRFAAFAAAASAGVLALTACSSGGSSTTAAGSTPPTSSASGSESVSPSPSPSPTDIVGIPEGASPFSGRPGGAGKKVLVVKFDNTPNAQPHSGLRSADIVYVEEVEFGLTRIAAVFSSILPKTVGPVRSARISDIDLLAQFGRPAFAYSGAQQRMRPVLAKASIYDVSGDRGPSGYYRDPRRRAPYNFFGVPTRLLARAPKASTAQDIGFVFSPTVPSGGRAVKVATVPYPASQAKFIWNAKAKSFDVFLNKKPARATEGGTQHASTVVIQYVAQHDSGYGDKFGGKTPMLETVGTGKAWVLRDGRAIPVTWTRSAATSGTAYTAADGSLVPFAAGQIWVVLVNTRSKATIA
jgi:hypothetical protein